MKKSLSNYTTVSFKTIKEIADEGVVKDDEVIRPFDKPVQPGGGLKILRGSLAPDGAVIKSAAVSAAMWHHRGPARVFDGEEQAMQAILSHSIHDGR
jgi:dihydroxy-acid dehydratase